MLIGNLPKNISKVHRRIADIYNKSGNKVYIEYPVKKILSNYWDKNEVPFHIRDIKLLAQIRDLSFDFFNDTTQTILEVQGKQHKEFNPFFHGNIGNFDIQKINDKLKVRVCKEVGIDLCTIDSDTKEDLQEFLSKI